MAYVNAPFLNTENQYTPILETEGKVLGRVRADVKSSSPQPGMKDYRFFVDPVSPLPEEMEEAQKFGFTGFMSRVGFGYNSFSSEAEAAEALKKSLGHCFVTFTPALRNKKFFVLEDMAKEGHTAYMDSDRDYLPLPALGTQSQPLFGGDVNKFCHHLLMGKPLPGLSKRYWNSAWAPKAVVCAAPAIGDKPGAYVVFAPMENEPFEPSVIEEGGAYFRVRHGALGYAVVYPAEGELAGHVLRCSNSPLWFVPRKEMPLLRANLKPVPDDGFIMGIHENGNAREEKAPVSGPEKTALSNVEKGQPALLSGSPADAGKKAEPVSKRKETTEKDFMDHFRQTALAKGLLYDDRDLMNFHISVKSSSMTILSGMSGTGKSGLVQLYGDSLGLPKEQVLFLPVRPSWMDDSDILGYADLKNMIYRPADTGLARFLAEAGRHPEKLYLVCFDEMNLSRAEYYFAQFISILEKEDTPVIRLYNPDLEGRLYNSASYPADIPIGKNVIFTGTVNIDESTYHFSDKILDRSNVITLHQRHLKDLEHLPKVKTDTKWKEVSAGVFHSFIVGNDHLEDREYDLLDAFNDTLEKRGFPSRIGFRVARQMGQYLNNIPDLGPYKRADGLDAQMVQRVLTKLRGSADQLSGLVGADDKGNLTGAIAELFDQYADLSPFSDAKACLLRKAEELKLYDYTI